MSESDIFDNYDEYVKGLPTIDLESICRDIDKVSHPDRYKIVSSELEKRLGRERSVRKQTEGENVETSFSQIVIGIIIFLGLLVFEFYLGNIKFANSCIPQLSRLALIFSVALLGAIFTRNEGIHSIKSTLIFLALGFGIVAIAVVPRYIENGMASTIDMMLLKEGIIGKYGQARFSIKSNFILATGYVFLCWAFIENIKNMFGAIKENT